MDCTDQFPNDKDNRAESWIMHALCECVAVDDLEKIVAVRDKTGKYDATMILNGVEVNIVGFFAHIEQQYERCVKEEAEKLIKDKIGIIDDIHERIKRAIESKLNLKHEWEE